MSLQFIIGSSGAGKSHLAYRRIIEASMKHPERNYYVIVPEQFTMQTQKTLVEMHPGKGILNIDILSFERLAYRVFEETGGDTRKVLEDTGKSMVLRKMVQKYQKDLPYLGSQMKKPGYLDEVKSLLSEFMQYDIREKNLEEMLERTGDRTLLQMKLKDVGVLYNGFREFLEGHYMTGEEVLDVLLKALPFSEKIRGSEMLFDGFTGFTPIQINVIRELLILTEKISVTVTMDASENAFSPGKPYQLFYMSRKMIRALSALTKELEDPVYVRQGEHSRFAKAPALHFLEQNIFRYRKESYDREQEEISLYLAGSPLMEMRETARQIAVLVRRNGYRYGEVAVITGNLEVYGNLAKQVFEEVHIPYFIDEKHSVLMNPFVEAIRAALEMAVKGFSYESVFRYLRSGMSGIGKEEADRLENYVIALGIRSFKKWSSKWVRIYRGMKPEEIGELNALRESFLEEVGILAEGFGSGRKTVEEYCRILYEYIVRCGMEKKIRDQELMFKELGNQAMEKEYSQIYAIVMELLDKMVEILGEETVTSQEFRQLLETGLGEAKVALIPPSMDQVMVGDMERTRLKDIKALFFVGVNEGNIPKNTQSGGILTEMDREFFEGEGMELAPGPKELMNMQRFYLYLNLTKPRERLFLSCSETNSKGEAVSPAYLMNTVKALYPGLEVRQAQEREMLPELPEIGIDYFLELLSGREEGQESKVFAELYSWYLKSPEYAPLVKRLVEASYSGKPVDMISKSVAGALYGEISPYSATRLERYSACAFAHFLQYGLRLSQRAEYEFRAMDMGNVMHQALEDFSKELIRRGLDWAQLTDELREEIADACLDKVCADYGNTVLKSNARNEYMIERTRRILKRTVWALQKQLENSDFCPEGFEVKIGGGRIDRVDVMEEEDRVWVRVIDYKTGNTSFDLVYLYHGLQLQLMVYLEGALRAEEKRYPGKEILPAGVFYYNIKDPMIQEKIDADVEELSGKIQKELKMNGLVEADPQMVQKMDKSLISLPVSFNKDGSFRKGSSVAGKEQFQALNRYVRSKIADIQASILDGNAMVEPYELERKNACTYCPYGTVCGFDKKLPGYQFRHLKNFTDDELWKALMKEEETEISGQEE